MKWESCQKILQHPQEYMKAGEPNIVSQLLLLVPIDGTVMVFIFGLNEPLK